MEARVHAFHLASCSLRSRLADLASLLQEQPTRVVFRPQRRPAGRTARARTPPFQDYDGAFRRVARIVGQISHAAVTAALIGLYCSEALLQIGSAVIIPGVAGCAAWNPESHWSGFSRFAHRDPYVPAARAYRARPLHSIPHVIGPCQPGRIEPPNRGNKIQPLPSNLAHIPKNRPFSHVNYQ